jgi:hypothetical protein
VWVRCQKIDLRQVQTDVAEIVRRKDFDGSVFDKNHLTKSADGESQKQDGEDYSAGLNLLQTVEHLSGAHQDRDQQGDQAYT